MNETEAYCKAGHWISGNVVDPARRLVSTEDARYGYGFGPQTEELDRFCAFCGAGVIAACGSCGAPFPAPGYVDMTGTPPPGFCRKCGSPQPWATREARVRQLTNLLQTEQLDDATFLAAQEAIMELAGIVSGDDGADTVLVDRQVEATKRLRNLAPGAWDFIKPVLQTLLTGAAKAQLGM
jgi:hypothetical protein